jgi:hypothetical protein
MYEYSQSLYRVSSSPVLHESCIDEYGPGSRDWMLMSILSLRVRLVPADAGKTKYDFESPSDVCGISLRTGVEAGWLAT